jgi:hypothetical protein
MFLGKNTKNLRSLFTAFALAMTVVLSGASIADAQTPTTRLNDFVGDNRTDWTTLQFPAVGVTGPIRWKTLQNPAPAAPNAAFRRDFDYGLSTDDITVGDYVGDSKSDPTVWRDSNAVFYVGNFPLGTGGITLNRAVQFGNGATDVPGAQGDYDGDGKTDFTLVRSTTDGLIWYILGSVSNTVRAVRFGTAVAQTGLTGTAVFPGADFTGDGRDELIVLNRNTAGTIVNYYIGDSITGAGVITRSFGNYNTDFSLAPDDYTGDGRADFVAVRETQGANAVWYIGNSQNTTVTATSFGLADPAFTDLDLPVRGDFDGDGRHDICVWRESNQTFYFVSTLIPGAIGGQRFGDTGDFPLGSFALY